MSQLQLPRELAIEPRAMPAATPILIGAMCLLTARAIIITVIGIATGGASFTDDAAFMIAFFNHPFQIIMGVDQGGPAFWPPLFPVVASLVGRPAMALATDFHAVRITSVAFELLAWPLIWLLICRFTAIRWQRVTLAATYIVMPFTWTATALFAQDESLSMLMLLGVVMLALNHRYRTACLLCGLGAITAKIHFLVPLLALVAGPGAKSWREYLTRALAGGLPVLAGYGWVAYVQAHNGMALTGFTPHGTHAVSLWALLLKHSSLEVTSAKNISTLVALVLGSAPLILARARGINLEGKRLAQLICLMLMSVFLWFYHADPEYYLMVVPLILISFRPVTAVVLCITVLSLPFAINLGYGVANAEATGMVVGGKAKFVSLYNRVMPVSADLFHTITLCLMIAGNLLMCALLYIQLLRRDATPEVQA